ncbi:hypothetical protein HIM_11745 [Hirsutella minnesotensis 3608]|uniref:Uncharacterized protein n=1 Tax=Hirsutella minnesotensis 3608 TaxID=1043627 RepID=A0A0F8A0U6_9HYPO|nr:hypothetical protein HIM_11745 [Hirsutella minnesotensis 3608]
MVQPDEAGLDFYLTRYKPFRLGALQRDPSCFSSTHAREASFTDDVWRDRLLRPTAKTFVAVVREMRAIVSSVTVVLGTPMPPELVSRLAAAAATLDRQRRVHGARGEAPRHRAGGIGGSVAARRGRGGV